MSLLERFREGSKYDSEGQFTLDEDRAKKKMARYQLARLEEYLLLAAQAVVAAGTGSIQIDIGQDEKNQKVTLRAANTRLKADKLKRLDNFLFARSEEATPYYLLGVAVNAIEPSCVGEPSLEVNEKGDFEFRTVLKKRFNNLKSMLNKALVHCGASVTINGEVLETDPLSGVSRQELCFDGTSSLTVVRYGVVIETKTLLNTPNFHAIVEDSRFSLDASFSHVVENQLYEKLYRALKKSASVMLADLAKNFSGDPLEHRRLLNLLSQKLEQPARSVLRNCDLFPLADSERFCSLEDLETQYRQNDKILYSDRLLNVQMTLLVVHRSTAWVKQALNSLYPPAALESAEVAYRRRVEAQRNKERWEQNERPTELAPGEYLISKQISGKGWQAVIGYSMSPGQPVIDLLYKGRLLSSESLKDDLPPGAQAVLNFDEVEIDEMWTRATGRRYRSAFSSVAQKLTDLFRTLGQLPQEGLYPELKRYLFSLLMEDKRPPKVARQTRLFPEVGSSRHYSLKELSEWSEVLVGDYVRYDSDVLIESVSEQVLIQYSRPVFEALRLRLGKQCIDYRETQAHLRSVERQLKNPKPAKLDKYAEMIREPFEFDNVEGEIALLPDAGSRASITLLHQGVELETLNKKLTKVLKAEVILSSPGFAPNHRWSQVTNTVLVKSVLIQVKKQLQALEERFISNQLSAEWSYRIELLSAYPDTVKDHLDTPLLHDHRGLRCLTLQDAQNEISERGHLLVGERHIQAGSMLVFRDFDKTEHKFLRQVLGEFELADAEKFIKTERAQAEFWNREPQEIGLYLKPYLSIDTIVGSGLLGLHLGREQGPRSLDCYYQGRIVTTKHDVLPSNWVGALESESFVLNEACNNCKVSKGDLIALYEQCMLEMVKALAQDNDAKLQAFAKQFFVTERATGKVLKELSEVPFLCDYQGEIVSPKDFDFSKKTWAYVGADFKVKVATDRSLLVLTKLEQKLLKNLSNVPRLRNVENDLKLLRQRLDYLDSLPKKLPKKLFSDTFEAVSLSADIGLADETSIVGMGPNGQVLGYMKGYRGLPVEAIVRGATLVQGGKWACPECELSGESRRLFTKWVHRLYLKWCEQVCHEFPSSQDRARALDLLERTKRELGSHHKHVLAAIANVLWDLPLFQRSDRTYVSGSSIMTQVTESESPVLVADVRRGAPAEALLFAPKSVEHRILLSVLGKKGLTWYERPPMFDAEQFKGNLKKIVSWGLSPFVAASQALTKSAMKRAALAEEMKEQSAEFLEKKFLSKMKSDLSNLLGRKRINRADHLFDRPQIGSWILGPAIYRSKSDGNYRFNRHNANIRWLIYEAEDERAQRVARYLLIIQWVGEVNVLSEDLTDEHEDRFLLSLTERMIQTFGKRT